VIGAVQDVGEPEANETPRRLVPAWIEPDEARVTAVFEGPFGRGWRLIAQDGDDVVAEARQRRTDREPRAIRGNRILEQRVEHRLSGYERRIPGKRRSRDVRQRCIECDERAIRGERDAGREETWWIERTVSFVQLDVTRQPEHRRVANRRIRARDVQHSVRPERKLDVPHRGERHTHE
jgi:hypothetical protein